MTKIKKLSFVFVGLLMVSLLLMWVGKKDRAISSVDKNLFAIADTTQITGIVIQYGGKAIAIQRGDNEWSINNQHKADPQLIYLSQRILSAVETQRPVSKSNLETIKKELLESGRQVTVELSGGESKHFYAGGNTAKTTAYFGNQDLTKIFTVAIPGYQSYLSGIFELTLNQWRDRVLFASSWRTVQHLTVDYADPVLNDLNIYFDNQFLAVNGVSDLDTTVLMTYLQPLEFFQLNDYLNPGAFPRYDSLLNVEPIAQISLEDINVTNNRQLKVYPKIDGQRFYLLTNAANEMMVVDEGRMQRLMAQPVQFQKE
ncbi:hypothetical protein SAMN04488029_0689 [Reichenbachiella faecimaris]|uniref:DUF4340 domain-containing protein n=1 Tax=Reichenbachiella faecimaris TaxID=692418 RepID=A0A1W2G757_REIFA|nr:hypothetical protein [Reichenbachiella faecimaris]SMD32344.1 hypothetical protein SAMN04488029_0689 [Reichenbachiella faecimaris]